MLITLSELATRLGVDVRTVQNRRAAGKLGIPVFDIATGNRPQPRVRLDDVEAYLKTRRVA